MSISVVIITHNSSLYLEKVLNSLKGFDEIIVCDMESTDDTVEIACHHEARVITFPLDDHTCVEPARNFAIDKASYDWVLVVEDDEIIPGALRRYLYKFIRSSKPTEALYIPRRNYILDRFRSAKYPDYQLRFFRKHVVDWPPYVNSTPEIHGKVGKIPANKMELAIIHIPHTITNLVKQLDAATDAEVTKNPNRKITLTRMVFRAWGSFFKSFIFKGGFSYGIPGYIAASHDAIYKFYSDAKVYETRVKAKIPGELPEERRPVLGEDKEV